METFSKGISLEEALKKEEILGDEKLGEVSFQKIKGAFTDPMFSRNIFDRFTKFLLVQNGDDLGLQESFLFHN
jgi:hypothetical protein